MGNLLGILTSRKEDFKLPLPDQPGRVGRRFALAVSLQVFIILWLVWFKLSIITGGTEITLRIQPYDPIDLLRGQYMTFEYTDISELSRYNFSGYGVGSRETTLYKTGDVVYVPLRRSGHYSSFAYSNGLSVVRKVPSTPRSGVVYLRGTIVTQLPREGVDLSGALPADASALNRIPYTISVKYGIENYFVPYGTPTDTLVGKELLARVAVDENGSAVLMQVYADGKEWP